ncbi:hypothetical protein GQ41_3224 [Arenibacter algicola]|uniref:O-antigen ligase n=1 Tax=Arenibacter algicola TaxID=616991 RepID=A0ABY3ADW4_9FLAO
MNRKIQIAIIFLLIMVTMKFFDAQFINATFVNYSLYLSIIGTVFISLPYIFPNGRGFVFPIQLLLVAVVLSIFMASIFWGQAIVHGMIATAQYLVVMFFFYLLRIKFPIETLEKIIVAYGIIYILLYFFQLANAPTVLFGRSTWGDEFTETRGIVRIIFPGGGVFVLTSFIAINKLSSKSKYHWFWLLLSLFGLIIPVLQVTRQFIAGIALIYLYHAIRNFSLTKKVFVFMAGIVIGFVVYNSSIPVIEGLIEASQNDVSEGADYIRILAGEYFLFDFSPDPVTSFFGNGVPYTGTSNYGIYMDMLEVEREFFLSDVGIITVYAMFGAPAIIAFIIIWIMSFVISVPKEYYYLKYYLWFLLMTSLTWYTTYHNHYLLITTLVLYIYQMVGYTPRSGFLQKRKLDDILDEDTQLK